MFVYTPSRVALFAALACGVLTAALTASPARAAPTSVTIAGSLQSELGCSGDWQPDCTSTRLSFDSNSNVWKGSFLIPAGSYEYKAALNDSWAENYGANGQPNGSNIPLSLGADTTVRFYYDDESHWVTDDRNSRIVTAAGSFQSELGCPGDWDPGCLRSWLKDVDGDGTFTFSTSALPFGNYEVKAALGESWDENYGLGGAQNGANIQFFVPFNFAQVQFAFVSSTNVLTVLVESAQVPTPAPLALLGVGLAGLGILRRRKTSVRIPTGRTPGYLALG